MLEDVRVTIAAKLAVEDDDNVDDSSAHARLTLLASKGH